MATFHIETPDGQSFEIEAPEGATENDAMQMVMQHVIGNDAKQARVPLVNPTEGMSPAQLFAAGAVKSGADLARGIGQWTGAVSRQDVADSRQTDAPLMGTTAGNIGNTIGNVGTGVLATMLAPETAASVAGAGLIGAGLGAAQPSTSNAETVANIALGGLLGAGGQKVANVAGKVLQTPDTNLTQAQKTAAKNNLGFRTTPGQAAGSKALQKAEAALESNPVTSGPFDALREQNQRRLNEIAAKAIGENSDELSAPVLGQAFDRIGAFYDTLNTPTPVKLDQSAVTQRLSDVLDNHAGQYNGTHDVSSNALWQNFDKFLGRGEATQAQLSRLSSNLSRAVKNQMTSGNGDRTMGLALSDLKEVVDDALMGSLPKAQQDLFDTSRQQYRTLMMLTGRLGVVNPSSGNVSGKTLANVLQQQDKRGFLRGQNQSDLYNAARFSQAFPDVVGNSGTATRDMGAMEWLASIPAGIASRVYLSQPVNALARTGTPMVNRAQNALAAALQRASIPFVAAGTPAATNSLLPLIYAEQ